MVGNPIYIKTYKKKQLTFIPVCSCTGCEKEKEHNLRLEKVVIIDFSWEVNDPYIFKFEF